MAHCPQDLGRWWIRAGELVFHYPVDLSPSLPGAQSDVTIRSGDLFGTDDISPFVQYVIRKKGVVEFGAASCADCHTRVMPDGSIVIGAQGNRPVERIVGIGMRAEYEKAATAKEREEALTSNRTVWHQEFWTPWVSEGPQSRILNLSLLEMVEMHEAIPPGVLARQRSSILYPPAIADLIGVKDIRYLDRSGLMRHRDIGDLMRYAAMNQGADMLASFGGFIPLGKEYRELPDPGTQGTLQRRAALCARFVRLLAPAAAQPKQVRSRADTWPEGLRPRGLCVVPHAPTVHQQQTDACR